MDRVPDVSAAFAEALQDRYRIERELGRGGMAAVHLARDLKHGRQVAVKVLDPEVGRSLGTERFLREIQISAGLSHPRIVPLLDSGMAAGLLYYVMPWVEGETLRDRLRRERQLPVEEAVDIARQVASALAHAHERGVVHRDVKPENILLSGREAVVADFGIARAVTVAGGTALTQTGLVMGTPAYMSPEQASGEEEPGPRSDVYALACVLYEMLAGEVPFAAPSAQALTARKLTGAPPDVRVRRDSVPAPLAEVVRKGLARVPADRHRSAAEMSEELARALEATGTGPLPVEDRRGRRTPLPHAGFLGASTLVVLALVFGWIWQERGRTGGAELFVQLPIDALREIGAPLTLAPDGRRLAYLRDDRLWIRDLPGLDPRAVPGSEGARLPFWSPDGSEVGYIAGGSFWRAGAQGGVPVRIGALGLGLTGGAGATWTADGEIVFATGSTGLMSIAARGGTPRLHVPLAEGEADHHDPHALPAGRGILFVPHLAGGDGAHDAIAVVAGGERRTLFRMEGHSIRYPVYSPTGHILFQAAGGIWAVPFSLRRLEVTGEPTLLRPGLLAPSTGPGGRLAVYQGPGVPGRELALAGRDGERGAVVLAPDVIQFYGISPAGSHAAMAVGSPGAIWVVELATGTRRRVTGEGESGNFPRWSPDGERIAYFGAAGGEPGIRIRRADGTGAPVEIARAWYPSFTPDGRGLVVTLGLPAPDEDWHVGYVPLEDGAEPIPIVATSAWECCAHVSPDGRYLAYASDASGRWEVYVTRFPSGEGVWQVSSAGGSWPRWSADGERLYYAQDETLMEVRVATGAEFRLSPPERLFDRGARIMNVRFGKPDYYDVMPDGERFLVLVPAAPEGEGPASAVVMGDWRAALGR